MSKLIEVSAPGKLILHGEHAVVYGKAAIAANLDLRCHLQIKKQDESSVSLDLTDINISRQWSIKEIEDGLSSIPTAGSPTDPSPASEETILGLKNFLGVKSDDVEAKNLAIIAFLYIYNSLHRSQNSFPSISIHMKSDLPVGAGLGSSAAFSVSVSASLLQLVGVINSDKEGKSTRAWNSTDRQIINKWGFILEKVIHGRPSGIDNSVSTHGGAIRFQKGEIINIEKMPTLPVMLVNTKVARSTLKLVAGFREKYEKHQEVFDPVLNAVEAISEKSLKIYGRLCDKPTKEDYTTIGELMALNHQLLNMMGVGHPSLDQIVTTATKHGLFAKLTGAGGGGCAFVLVPPGTDELTLDKVSAEMENLGFAVWRKTSVGGDGVLQHL